MPTIKQIEEAENFTIGIRKLIDIPFNELQLIHYNCRKKIIELDRHRNKLEMQVEQRKLFAVNTMIEEIERKEK